MMNSLELDVADYLDLSQASKDEVQRFLESIGAEVFSTRYFRIEQFKMGEWSAEVHTLMKNEDGSFFVGESGDDVAWEIVNFLQVHRDGAWIEVSRQRIN